MTDFTIMFLKSISELPVLPQVSESFSQWISHFFTAYTASYYKKDDFTFNRHVELKQIHIKNVCAEIRGICNSLGMNKRQLAFAEIIARLHDIGRFEQFERYRTFSDADSENHSEMTLQIIEEYNLLKDLMPEMQQIILQAILNHNQPVVPDNEPPLIDFYSRLLRDADKLDIWRIVVGTNIFHSIHTEPLPDTYEVPDEMLECFKKNSIVTIDMVDSFYDIVLFRLSWVFDINFSYTLNSACERNVFGQLLAKLPSSEKLDKIVQIIGRYVN